MTRTSPTSQRHDHDAATTLPAPATPDVRERRPSLWLLVVGPTVWATHFLFSYVSAAIWCAKLPSPDDPLGPIRWLVAGYTLVALVAIGLTGWRGWRHHRASRTPVPHDAPTALDRRGFLGLATALLCGLSFVAVVYETLPILFIETCR